MFVFDQVNLCPPSIFVFDVTSSLPVVSDNVIYKEVTKVTALDVDRKSVKCGNSRYRT